MRLIFPYKGSFNGTSFEIQPPNTSFHLKNVRPFDVLENRARGGQRPGLKKMYVDQISGDTNPITAMCSVTVII